MTGLIPVSPSRVWVRHVKRDPAGTLVVSRPFKAQAVEGVNGRHGWQNADITEKLSDDGQVTVRFPNVTGEDGIRHIDRFAVLTDPGYVPGEEWIEVMRDAHEPVAVFTPVAPVRVTPQAIEITGYDVAGYLQGMRASEVDLWPGYAPRDVFEHYTQLAFLVAGRSFLTDWAGSGASGTDDGWAYTNITASDGHASFSRSTGTATISRATAAAIADCWTAQARARVTRFGNGTNAAVRLEVQCGGGQPAAAVSVRSNGDVYVEGGVRTGPVKAPRKVTVTWPAAIDLKIVCRYDRLYYFANGELMGTQRRAYTSWSLSSVTVTADAGTSASTSLDGVFESCELEQLAPFAMRGDAKGDRRLPGLPTPGGLRARWLNEAATGTTLSGNDFHAETLSPLTEPAATTLEPAVDFASGWAPTGLPGKWSAYLTGAIRLNLATGDLAVRLTTSTNLRSKVLVGDTIQRFDDPAVAVWDYAAPTTYTSLRSRLGQQDGWYPIRIELSHEANTLASALQLQVAPLTAGVPGTWTTVATTDLSPYGCYENEVRLETHREVLKQITEQFGYQWVTQPCPLESGLFPGQIVPYVRVGVDRNITIDTITGAEPQTELDAGDSIDRLIVDAAGIASEITGPDGSEQITAQITDYESALDHLGLIADYESLSEITEVTMLQQRTSALLALRAGPNEQVGVRPLQGISRPVVQTIPLTGELARMSWSPGDGVKLDLSTIGVKDLGPRQLTQATRSATPDGFGIPQIGFRQRPRGADIILRRALRAGIASQRNAEIFSQVQRYRKATA